MYFSKATAFPSLSEAPHRKEKDDMPCLFIQKPYQGFQFSSFTSFNLTSPPLDWTFLFGCLSCTQQSVSSFFLNIFTILFLSHAIRNDSPLWYPHMIINKPFSLIFLIISFHPSHLALWTSHQIYCKSNSPVLFPHFLSSVIHPHSIPHDSFKTAFIMYLHLSISYHKIKLTITKNKHQGSNMVPGALWYVLYQLPHNNQMEIYSG